MRGLVIAALGCWGCLALAAPAAAAPAPDAYGGGSIKNVNSFYEPTVGVSLERTGSRLAIRWDAPLRCGRIQYFASAHKVVSATATHGEATGRGAIKLGKGRVRFTWRLTVDLDATTATGELFLIGNRRGQVSCNRNPRRQFRALLATPPTGSAATPLAGALYLGLSNQRVSGGLRGPVLVRVSPNGKVGARWTAQARCRNGAHEPLVNYSPPRAPDSGGGFSIKEHYRVSFSNALSRYNVFFRGHFTSDGAVGQFRVRIRVYRSGGKRLITRCDSGLRRWTVLGPAPG